MPPLERCKVCNIQVKDLQQLAQHLLQHMPETESEDTAKTDDTGLVECELCHIIMPSELGLSHLRTHHFGLSQTKQASKNNRKDFKKGVKKTNLKKKALIKKRANIGQSNVDSENSKRINTLKNAQKGRSIASKMGKEMYMCEICDMILDTLSKKKQHRNQVHKDKPTIKIFKSVFVDFKSKNPTKGILNANVNTSEKIINISDKTNNNTKQTETQTKPRKIAQKNQSKNTKNKIVKPKQNPNDGENTVSQVLKNINSMIQNHKINGDVIDKSQSFKNVATSSKCIDNGQVQVNVQIKAQIQNYNKNDVHKTSGTTKNYTSKINNTSDNKKNKHTLYKCTTCGDHFTKRNTLLKHNLINKDSVHFSNGEPCQICKLTFTKWSLKKHLQDHIKFQLSGREDFAIETVTPKQTKEKTCIPDMTAAVDRKNTKKSRKIPKDQNITDVTADSNSESNSDDISDVDDEDQDFNLKNRVLIPAISPRYLKRKISKTSRKIPKDQNKTDVNSDDNSESDSDDLSEDKEDQSRTQTDRRLVSSPRYLNRKNSKISREIPKDQNITDINSDSNSESDDDESDSDDLFGEDDEDQIWTPNNRVLIPAMSPRYLTKKEKMSLK